MGRGYAFPQDVMEQDGLDILAVTNVITSYKFIVAHMEQVPSFVDLLGF